MKRQQSCSTKKECSSTHVVKKLKNPYYQLRTDNLSLNFIKVSEIISCLSQILIRFPKHNLKSVLSGSVLNLPNVSASIRIFERKHICGQPLLVSETI